MSSSQASIVRRFRRAAELSSNPKAQSVELELCRRSVEYWFDNWAWTFDPRLASIEGEVAFLPFDLFPRQREMLAWLDARVTAQQSGLLEKSRDVGFTYLAGGYALHAWLFRPGFVTTFASRNVDLVDKIGDPDSIFEKLRIMLRALPAWMLPKGFNSTAHDNYKRLVNPANENTIRGEGGSEIGRGGRSSLLILDEGAFIEKAEKIEASTSANTNVRIWASTVNGMGNFFARKRFGGGLKPEQIFRFHWSDDPRKDEAWAEAKREELKSEPWIFASEYDIDYSASVEGICIPAKWVEAAKKIAQYVKLEPDVRGVGGQDIGAGKARSVFVPRFGPIVQSPTAWGDPDTIETAYKGLAAAEAARPRRSNGTECRITTFRYDSVGVGHGVTASLTRANVDGLAIVATNTGMPPSDTTWPDGMEASEKFFNMKAEAWWTARERFKCTYECLLHFEGKKGGQLHHQSEMISLPPDSESPEAAMLNSQLSLVKWGRDEKGKIAIEGKKALAKRGIASPDYADALILTFCIGGEVEEWLAAFGDAA